jgi:hypothetical protein
VLFGCRSADYTNTGYSMDPHNFTQNFTCDTDMQCFKRPDYWRNDKPYSHHRWNPFALHTVFEYLSAGFAMFYMRKNAILPGYIQDVAGYIGIAIHVIGLIVYVSWFFVRNQVCTYFLKNTLDSQNLSHTFLENVKSVM